LWFGQRKCLKCIKLIFISFSIQFFNEHSNHLFTYSHTSYSLKYNIILTKVPIIYHIGYPEFVNAQRKSAGDASTIDPLSATDVMLQDFDELRTNQPKPFQSHSFANLRLNRGVSLLMSNMAVLQITNNDSERRRSVSLYDTSKLLSIFDDIIVDKIIYMEPCFEFLMFSIM